MAHSKAATFFKSQGDNSKEEKRLMEPLSYMSAKPGRGRTQIIIQVFQSLFGIPNEEFAAFKKFVFQLLFCFLLVDDIADGSELRRGIPCSYLKYGIQLTRRTTSYCIFLAARTVLRLNNGELIECILKIFLQSYKGQGLEIYWRDNCICPTEEEYKRMAARKTGSMPEFIFPLANCIGEIKHQQDWHKISGLFGMYFQIRDDHRNLTSTEFTESKGFCEDLSEGKFSFPVVHAIKTRPDDNRVFNIVKQKPKDEETKRYCLFLLQEFGSLDYTYQTIEAIKNELIGDFENIPYSLDVINMVEETFKSQLE